MLTPVKQGNARALTCRFPRLGLRSRRALHQDQERGRGVFRPRVLPRERFNLRRIGALASYKGFVFGSLTSEVPALEDHLGAAARWIDLLADQAPDGLEVVPRLVDLHDPRQLEAGRPRTASTATT